MNKRIIRKSEYRQMRWANGGGLTDELFVFLDRETGRMHWRISMADVSLDGPFSRFEGYDRVLVLLNGRGLRLNFDSGKTVSLHNAYDQAIFPGDVETFATLRGGPIKDFNVIVARDTLRAAVSVLQDGGNLCVPAKADTLAVLAIEDDILVTDPHKDDIGVRKGDLFIVQKPDSGGWKIAGATSIITLLVPHDRLP